MTTRMFRTVATVFIIGLTAGSLAIPTPVRAATYVVNTTDSRWDMGDWPCTLDHCSLWEAAVSATVHPGPDRITFNLPGDGPHIIYIGDPEEPGRVYQEINLWDDQTEIDATTQPGWPIYLHGLGEAGWGMIVHSNRNTIRGLGFLGFTEAGVEVLGNGNFLDRIVVGEYLGEELIPGPTFNEIGVRLWRDDNSIRGASIANNGIGVDARGSHSTIQDSRIGTVIGGGTRRGNDIGIDLDGDGATIERNTIVGNVYGLFVDSNGTTIVRNYVGWDPIAGLSIGNDTGILLQNREGYNRVGGTDTYEGNVIAGNDIGIHVAGPGNQILNNRIGTDFSGAAFPNRIGVIISLESVGTLLGSGFYGAGNIIAYNTEDGVLVSSTSQVGIQHNTIHSNGWNGIHLVSESSPPADGMKITIRRNSIYDNGRSGIYIPVASFNGDLQHPTALRFTGSAVTGRACPGCTVEVYETDLDPSGFGEGKTFLGNGTAGSDGSFSIPVEGLGACSQVTATATDELGNTSDFSLNANALLCLHLPVVWVWIIILGGGGAGAGAALLVVTRRKPLTLRNGLWLILGALTGIVIGLLILRLPFMEITFPSPGSQAAPNQAPDIPTLPVPLSKETPWLIITQPPSDTLNVTPTTTPTNSTPTATLLQNAYCRRGPGTDYDSVTTLPAGLNVPIVGRNQNRTWWQVQVPGTQTQCWLADGNVETSGDTSQVPVIEVEPLGCWVKQQQGPDKCIAPCPQGAQPGGACEP